MQSCFTRVSPGFAVGSTTSATTSEPRPTIDIQSRLPSSASSTVAIVIAAAMTIATVLEALDGSRDWMSIGGRGLLVVALVVLPTAKPGETRVKQDCIYVVAAVSI